MHDAERRIRTLAAAAGITSLRALASEAHIDRMTLRFALRGEREPRVDTVDRIARTLHVEPLDVWRIFAAAREARP